MSVLENIGLQSNWIEEEGATIELWERWFNKL